MIDRFDEEYSFLSNFYPCKVIYKGHTFLSSEAAYQAQKDLSRTEEFINLGAKDSKHLGKKVNIRPDWEEVKLPIMEEIVRAKFEQNKDLAEKLIATGDEELIEGNYWHDCFWGVCNGQGENHLGQILMQIRGELKEKFSS